MIGASRRHASRGRWTRTPSKLPRRRGRGRLARPGEKFADPHEPDFHPRLGVDEPRGDLLVALACGDGSILQLVDEVRGGPRIISGGLEVAHAVLVGPELGLLG